MDGNQSVTAVFYQVELTVTKTGEGEVTTTPYGNTEEPTFTEKYAPDEPVVLKAVPEDGWFFVGWSGAVTSASSTVQIDMTEDKAVHALFERIELTVQKQGQGNVTASPPGGQVSVPFTEGYNTGQQVTLHATPAPGWGFKQWMGELNPSGATATTIMNSSKTVTAVFAQSTLHVDKEGEGTVSVSPPGGVQVLPFSQTYGHGAPVLLHATPSANWVFHEWSGGIPAGVDKDQDSVGFSLNSNTNMRAVFLEWEFWKSDPDPTGSIVRAPGVSSVQSYPGVVIQLSALNIDDWDTHSEYDPMAEEHVETLHQDTASARWNAQIETYSHEQVGGQLQFTAPNTVGAGTVKLHSIDGRDESDTRADATTEVDSIPWENLVPSGETVVWAKHLFTDPHWGDEFSHRLLPTSHSFYGMSVKEKLEFVSSTNSSFNSSLMGLAEGPWIIDQDNWRYVTDKHGINLSVSPYNVLVPGDNVIIRQRMYVTSNNYGNSESGPFYAEHEIELYVYLDSQQRKCVGVKKGGVQAP